MNDQHATLASLWPKWMMLVIFAFIGFESILMGAALKGSWFILIAPGIVCGVKALETWRDLRRHIRAIIDRDAE